MLAVMFAASIENILEFWNKIHFQINIFWHEYDNIYDRAQTHLKPVWGADSLT